MFLSDYHKSNSEYQYWTTEFEFINRTLFNNPGYTVGSNAFDVRVM